MRITHFTIGLAALFAFGAAPAAAQSANDRLPTSRAPVPQRVATTAAQVAPPAATPDNLWHLDLSTGGRVTVQLRPDIAPNHVDRIKTLTRQGFYNGLSFHRVIAGFMAQGGDPQGTGEGGSPLPDLAAEFNILPHVRGAVAMARASEPDSANSQFYIMLAPRLSLDGKYTVLGRVVSGMAFVDAIEKGEPPAAPSRIVRASIGSDNVPPPTPAEIAAAVQQQQAAAAAAAAMAATPAQSTPAEGATPTATPEAAAAAPAQATPQPAPEAPAGTPPEAQAERPSEAAAGTEPEASTEAALEPSASRERH